MDTKPTLVAAADMCFPVGVNNSDQALPAPRAIPREEEIAEAREQWALRGEDWKPGTRGI